MYTIHVESAQRLTCNEEAFPSLIAKRSLSVSQYTKTDESRAFATIAFLPLILLFVVEFVRDCETAVRLNSLKRKDIARGQFCPEFLNSWHL